MAKTVFGLSDDALVLWTYMMLLWTVLQVLFNLRNIGSERG